MSQIRDLLRLIQKGDLLMLKSMSKSKPFLAALLLAVTCACQARVQPQPGPSAQGSTSPGLTTLAAPSDAEVTALRNGNLTEAQTRFGLKMFQDLFAQQPRSNHFMSPLSLSIALAMLYNGASGDTQQEMAQAMQLNGLSLAELNQGNLTLRKRLANPGSGVEILIANALWGKQGVSFKADFLKDNSSFYNAQLTALDFATPAAISTINQWASDNTRGKIPKVVEQIDAMTILLLMNAIYFKGDWSEPFKESDTQALPFHKADGSTKDHPMMARSDKFRYVQSAEGKFQAVALPYGKDEQSEMLLFLPDAGQSLESLVSQLSETSWKTWMSQLRSRQGRVVMPRFKLKTEMPLNETMKRLGMSKAFSEAEAQFERLAEGGLKPFVSSIKQDAFVEVNEKGTEATAVTTITVGATSVQIPQQPFEMLLDRPFVYAIYDKRTESILFMGALNEPQ
jgi:serine protease inhibitor